MYRMVSDTSIRSQHGGVFEWRCVRTLYMTLPGGNTACVVTLNVRVENGVVIDVSSGTISVLVTVY
jgi:hypothetical protein